MKNNLVGKWRLIGMELWDANFIDLVEEGNITLMKNGLGHFAFGAVSAELDYQIEKSGNKIEFTWSGSDEGDQVSGRGSAEIKGEKMIGRLHFHLGDNSAFEAIRKSK